MNFLKTASLVIFFGSFFTFFRKYQSTIELSDGDTQFKQPIVQTFVIFLGMSSIGLVRPWIKNNKQSEQGESLPKATKYLYILPCCLDVAGTIADSTGIFYTSISISQMLKGSIIFFTYLITLFYLRRKFTIKKHLYMFLILISLVIVGSANLDQPESKLQSNPLLGNCLILVSQFLFSFVFIYQETILRQYEVKVENAVFWQGLWGTIISGMVLLFFLLFDNPIGIANASKLIYSSGKLVLALVMTGLCMAPFCYFGMSLTKQGSALLRCMINTMRMVVVWLLSLVFQWEKFHLIQFVGYILLTFGIYQFNRKEPEVEEAATNEAQSLGTKDDIDV